MRETTQRGNALFYALVVVVAILVGLGVYYVGLRKGANLNPQATQQKSVSTAAGITKLQELITTNAGVIARSQGQLSYLGTLKSSSEKSWTIERAGKTATITNEADREVRYLRSDPENKSSQEIKANEVKVGSLVSITAFVDLSSGKVSVSTVVLLPETTKGNQN